MGNGADSLSSNGLVTDSRNSTIAAIITAGVVATVILGIIPVFVAGIVNELGLGDREVGLLASADMCGSSIAALIGLSLQPRIGWRRLLAGAIFLAVGGNLCSILQSSFWLLISSRVLAGFGNGFVIALVFISLCNSRNPDRNFGFYTLGQLGTQTVLLSTLPYLINSTGMIGVYLFLAVASLLSISLIRYFPKGIEQVHPDAQPQAQAEGALSGVSRWAILALTALTGYFIAIAAIWSYLEPIGGAFSLTLVEVGHALGSASLIGIAGPLAVVIFATRFGRLPSLTFGVCLHLISALILIYGSGYFQFFLAASLFAFALNYSFPYQMGILSDFDRNGAVAVIALILQMVSFTFGPVLASWLLLGGYSPILWSGQLLFVLALCAYWVSVKRQTVT